MSRTFRYEEERSQWGLQPAGRTELVGAPKFSHAQKLGSFAAESFATATAPLSFIFPYILALLTRLHCWRTISVCFETLSPNAVLDRNLWFPAILTPGASVACCRCSGFSTGAIGGHNGEWTSVRAPFVEMMSCRVCRGAARTRIHGG